MIKLEQVRFEYKNVDFLFDLSIPVHQKVVIVGASGSGKSTLLNLLAGFEFATQGIIWLNNENHTQSQPHQRPVSMLFQENNLFMHLTVAQNIALGLKPSLKLSTLENQQVEQVASAVGLGKLLAQSPKNLSGGQKQRVALARCLLRDKPILLLDEPFSALDPELRAEMLHLILTLCDDKKLTLLMVTHQLSEVRDKVDRIIQIKNGRSSDLSLLDSSV
ncbi:thiamine ABC transporter ATP-binding protein [Pasteurella canis]|uniref:Thiamine import ATP-binding protein ThiQ n=1 Tax=Pasteurella canis TaxID=753 RepID=A0ABQ4VG17_9PAST|nr:thiamine ABC transporter ATP-binding protein [Pasteurella canis]UEC24161.1 thiamine ABC transporter ATP-binding protein [Pasteurella canis]GJH42831.1 thiamine import ATP-binding protein ThiQ [Pasteurella canis]